MLLQVAELVLATDMSRHRQYYSEFQEWCTTALKDSGAKGVEDEAFLSWIESRIPTLNPAERTLLMCMVLKCADLANVVKPVDQAEAWAHRIMLEFYAQVNLALLTPHTVLRIFWKPYCFRSCFLWVEEKFEARLVFYGNAHL